MRRRPALLLTLAVLVLGLMAAALALGPRGRDRAPPPAAVAAPGPAPGFPAELAEALGGGQMAEVLAPHKAVRLAGKRFHGKVLDLTLEQPTPAEAAQGAALVYRLRMLTRARDVLEIRMDAVDGRFLDLRGADLSAVRRGAGPDAGARSGRGSDPDDH